VTDIPEVSPQTSLREQKDREGEKDQSTHSGPHGPWMSVRKGNPSKKLLLTSSTVTHSLVGHHEVQIKEVRTSSLVIGCTKTLIC
jgi:hypothetical protein